MIFAFNHDFSDRETIHDTDVIIFPREIILTYVSDQSMQLPYVERWTIKVSVVGNHGFATPRSIC
jgi:hypothetical protein